MTYKPTNREKSREPRGRGFWCGACDHDIVFNGAKCGYCGTKQKGKRRFKKPTKGLNE